MPRGIPGSLTHGHSGYRHGCRCDDCREGHRIYVRHRYRVRHGYPETSVGYVDASPYWAVFAEIRGLYGRRYVELIEAHTGLNRHTISRITCRFYPRMLMSTAERARRAVELLP